MSIADLESPASPTSPAPAPMRSTAAQDVARHTVPNVWYRRKRFYAVAGGVIALAILLAWLAHSWAHSGHVVSSQTLEISTVTRGDFVQDVAARGTVIAAVSPTLSSTAAGTVTYLVHAGDRVAKGEVLARLSSPELENEYERERTTLASMDAALAQQRVELRQQLLDNRQRADLAAVTMSQQLRELQRLQAAWTLHVISEQRYEGAYDAYSIARLDYENANQNARLERNRIMLELRTRGLARNAQSLLVDGLKRRLDALTVRSPVDGMVAEAANGGTLFLDELGNLAPAGQAKLLRVLQTGELERLGSNITRRTQVRMIAATNTDLRAAIRDGRFREDLYYRLNVIELELPPLCRRREDILPLARHFLGGGRELSAEAERALMRHSWPGNVRELQNVIRRACLLSTTPAIGAQALGLPAAEQIEAAAEPAVDRAAVEQALQRTGGVVAHAARDLGLSRQALYRRMEKLGIKPD